MWYRKLVNVFGIVKSSLGCEGVSEDFHERWKISEGLY
jgi:hypothetical protein